MDTPLRNVRTNIVQSIRAFAVKDLQAVNPDVEFSRLEVGQKVKLPKK